ncbi:SAM-dependent methyltransferase [Streptomyces sp. SGAir0957]
MRTGYAGTGPGAITPDGCAVELYSRLPVEGEPDIVAGAVPAGATLLELGCGVGRVTHPLVERGFTVTAVDESPEMLERVRGARTVRSTIEGLDLGERFDVVMLGSILVNTGDAAVRRGMLDTCRRHVAEGGRVVIQRERDGVHEGLPREHVLPDGAVIRKVASEEVAGSDGVRSVRVEYVFPDAVWTQTYRIRPMVVPEFERALAEAGLRADRYLTEDESWVRAVPV